MPAFTFEIKTDQATEDKIRAKKILNIWFVRKRSKDGFIKIGSWYRTKEDARAHIKRAIKNVIFKYPSTTEMVPITIKTDYQGIDELVENKGNVKKKLFIAGGSIAGLTALSLIFRKKIKQLFRR